MSCSRVSVVPSQRSFPQLSVQRSSAGAESQVGVWTPLVTCPIGISSSGADSNDPKQKEVLREKTNKAILDVTESKSPREALDLYIDTRPEWRTRKEVLLSYAEPLIKELEEEAL